MKRSHKWLAAAMLAVMALLALPVAAYAAPVQLPALDEVVFGRDFTLASGRTITGDLVVLGGSLTMEADSTVTGQAVVIGGDATVEGNVRGDLVVVGGAAMLQAGSRVGGDLIVPTGQVTQDAAAMVAGSVVQDVQLPWGDQNWRNPGYDYNYDYEYARGPQSVVREAGRSAVAQFVWLLFRSVAMATVALLLVLFTERHMRRISDTLIAQPPLAAGIGLVGVVTTVVVAIILSITILLIPLAALLPFVLVVAWAFGWISLGLEVGRRLGDAFKALWSPALQATFGTFALTFATGVVSWVPCVGWILGAVVGLAGLGAVILTRFGSQAYPVAGGPPAPVVAPSAAPALPAPRKRAVKKTPAKKTTRS